jgi:hypothetical protein
MELSKITEGEVAEDQRRRKLKEPHMHGDLCNGLYACYKTPTRDEFVTQP